uniref:Zinc finger CCCH domain-containing protein 14 n=1 Tax=Propithecus coquereli TaxID=379532 RepID=A0A2K6GJL2_PROCO
MEIGTEISRKIRSAIKGKLQELGAYVDEELPDYIMVMVANKKSQDQMTEDLSLFLGNNTIRFTVQTYDDGAATRLMSTVKPLREPAPSEDVIDIKPEPDDLIDEDLNFVQENPLSQKKPTVTLTYGSSRPSIEIYRPPASRNADSGVHLNRMQFQQQQNSIHAAKQLDIQNSRVYETGHLCEPEVLNSLEETYSPFFRNNSEKMSIEDENFRKRKLPVVSSVVKVKKFNHDGEEEEEDDDYGSRTGGVSSSVSVPAKPERRPSLPPSKQANKNLILKAISEAQESVTKTTNYSTGTQQRQLLSRLQIDPVMAETLQISQDYYDMESMVHADTRSFILKKPKLSEEVVVAPTQESGMKTADTLRVLSGHLMQTRDLVQPDKPASPKFIVTLDGVPSPPGYMSDQEEDMCFEGMKPVNQTAASNKGLRGLLHPQQLQLLSRQLEDPNGSFSNAEMSELSVAQKPEKLLERCKYWPACKNGDECAYHHPISPCKAFPNCKFAEKCLFVHPNCKYDAKCTKPDCPFTHMSRRIPILPPKPAVTTAIPPSSSQLCRYFPACKKMECPFYHPKHCRFNTQCTRPDCTFYHPTITVPPRHALKWIRPQTSE